MSFEYCLLPISVTHEDGSMPTKKKSNFSKSPMVVLFCSGEGRRIAMAAQDVTSTGLLVVLSSEREGGRMAMTTWTETSWILVVLYCNVRGKKKDGSKSSGAFR